MKGLPEPLNSEERYLHAIALRVDALCNMMDSFLKVYAEQNAVATINNTEVEVKEKEPVIVPNTPVPDEVEDNQCNGITKAGNRCKGTKMNDSDYCAVHAPKE